MDDRLIEWVEPFDPDAEFNLICRMKARDAAEWQFHRIDIAAKGFKYESLEQALDDFMVVHWAVFVNDSK